MVIETLETEIRGRHEAGDFMKKWLKKYKNGSHDELLSVYTKSRYVYFFC